MSRAGRLVGFGLVLLLLFGIGLLVGRAVAPL
jgi:hypothetical protein